MASDLIVVARRWDGLGARLQALLNAWSIARALDLEFRFVWPRNSFKELHEPREIFDGGFLEHFEIAAATCADRITLPSPTALSLPEARALCRAATPHSMFDVGECFDVLAFAGEPAAAAQARFRAGLSEIAWSGVARALIESVPAAADPGGYSAIHVRAGDIVEGDWRQFVPVEKLIPTPYVEFAIESFAGPDASPVVVVSDNERYVRYLKTRFGLVRVPGDLVGGYARLSEAQRALADILVLSRARRVVGPRTSAFSQLAAHLGGGTIQSADDLMTENAARRRLHEGIARAGEEAARWEVLRPLLARDICWFLDVFSDHLGVGEQVELARRAVRCEPAFCGALNRLATALAFAGKGRASAEASCRAQRAAARSEIHADPSVESLATSISARVVIALGTRRHAGQRLLEWLGLASLLRRFERADRAAMLDEIKRSLERCEALRPFQTHHQDVMVNLRFQLAAMAWLTTADARSQETVRRAMRPAESAPLLLPSWRPSGWRALRGPGSFPQTLRNLEVATIRIAQAIGAALSGAPSSPPPMGRVEAIRTCPSGLRWASGWAYDPDAGRSDLAVGFFSNDFIVSGGTTFLERPDVAAALDDPRALNCGFAFPVPSTDQDEAGELQASLRISSPVR